MRPVATWRWICAVLPLLAVPALGAGPKGYPDPDSASAALVAAARTGDVGAITRVLGDDARPMLASGDRVADRTAVERFVALYDQSHALVALDDTEQTLVIGDDRWPFPIPLVKGKAGWTFDVKAGQAEVLARRVGQNELDAIQVCLGYVGAQREYRARNPEGAATPHYADRLMSSPGKRDGLYWPASAGEAESPMGPAVSGAMREGYTPAQGKRTPYRGYLYRILSAQGGRADGGALDYREGGHLTRGFGLVAYPASYGKSGVMTFVVNQDGIVFEKDLGPNTSKTAGSMSRFDPGDGWRRAAP